MNTLQLYRSRTGYRWRFTARNGRILANGGQGYSRRRDMISTIATVFPDFVDGWTRFKMSGRGHSPIKVNVKDKTRKPSRHE